MNKGSQNKNKGSPKYFKMGLTSLAITGRQIKTTWRFYLPQVRMTMIRIEMKTNAGMDVRKGSPKILFARVLTSAATIGSFRRFLKKLEIKLLWFSYLIPGQILKGLYNVVPQRHVYFLVYCSSVHKIQETESTKMSISQ